MYLSNYRGNKWAEACQREGGRASRKKDKMPSRQKTDGAVAGSSKRLASMFYQLKTGHRLLPRSAVLEPDEEPTWGERRQSGRGSVGSGKRSGCRGAGCPGRAITVGEGLSLWPTVTVIPHALLHGVRRRGLGDGHGFFCSFFLSFSSSLCDFFGTYHIFLG